ncbi:MAG TPA: ribonuclease R [Candidatus Paceibacterota bacterium]|nr:ribonuclease R [Candidatus Paceibacterota bacterium]
MRGVITTINKGYGRIIPIEDGAEIPKGKLFQANDAVRITVMPEFVNTALPGDVIEYQLEPGSPVPQKRSPKVMERFAQVKSIIQRARIQHVGYTKEYEGKKIFVADDKRIYTFFYPTEDIALGKKVIARITKWENGMQPPMCEIIQVIGNKGDHNAEIQSLMIDKGIQAIFPPAVERDAAKINAEERTIPESERKTRRDFTKAVTFTIDPKDAKDFDDAISVEKLPVGKSEQNPSGEARYIIGIHIADVSFFVRSGTALDDEAQKRATSVYLVDRVIPMLPEVLSNDLCSLNPYEERRAFSAVFEMNENGEIFSRWFGRTAIVSKHRYSYEDAQEVIVNQAGQFAEEMGVLSRITRKLREQKMREGAIDFDTEEVKFILDENGSPLRVEKKTRFEAHRLIEDLMLLANKEVAKHISAAHKKLGASGMYRIHEGPTKEKMADLLLLYKALGYDLNVKLAEEDPRAIQQVLQKLEGKPEASLIKTATIRAMSKAIYATENTGHYGLAFQYYTHFTSPIRRYPDLEVHRLLQAVIDGKVSREHKDKARLMRIAEQSTLQEISAADAERASIKMKQVEYMSRFIGQEFTGVISGISEWGLYIEDAETKSEGMARLKDLTDDYYAVEERMMRAVGMNKKKTYSLGDKVIFRVVSANIEDRTLDYAIVKKLEE